MQIQLHQDGQTYVTDSATFRQWLAEGRVRANALVNVGAGWQSVSTFTDARQFATGQSTSAGGDIMKVIGIGAALLGGAVLLSKLFESEEEVEKKASSGTIRRSLFLSFDYDDKEKVDGFRLLTYNRYVDLEFRDGSLRRAINSENEAYIRQRLREQMVGTSVCVCLIGDRTYSSDWVDWELRTCAAEGKGLLGIHLKDKRGPVPMALTDLGARVIKWDPHSFADAIEDAARAVGR